MDFDPEFLRFREDILSNVDTSQFTPEIREIYNTFLLKIYNVYRVCCVISYFFIILFCVYFHNTLPMYIIALDSNDILKNPATTRCRLVVQFYFVLFIFLCCGICGELDDTGISLYTTLVATLRNDFIALLLTVGTKLALALLSLSNKVGLQFL
jgi:hypothetical protein